MKAFILGWTGKAEVLVTSSIVWSSASQLQEQIRAHQASNYAYLTGSQYGFKTVNSKAKNHINFIFRELNLTFNFMHWSMQSSGDHFASKVSCCVLASFNWCNFPI